jgi:hypothetical protein
VWVIFFAGTRTCDITSTPGAVELVTPNPD